MKTNEVKIADVKLSDVYDVHHRDPKSEQWYRWMNAPVKDIQKCHDWIAKYGNPETIAGLIYLEGSTEKREFRIVKCERTITEQFTR